MLEDGTQAIRNKNRRKEYFEPIKKVLCGTHIARMTILSLATLSEITNASLLIDGL
jgi:hypothetical protein